MTEELEKRKWCYVQHPSVYEIAPCACGNVDTQWSEFKGRLWCDRCAVDFIPEHNGIFDGPIPLMTSAMLGISFDRINLETNEIKPFETDPPNRSEARAPDDHDQGTPASTGPVVNEPFPATKPA
jgi:hypothetical protein